MASRSVEIFLIANADKWIKGIDKATAKADELGRAIQKQKNIADMSFKAGAALFVGAAGMIAATVGPAIKLEDAVGRIAAQTGLTGEAYSAFTKKLSADTKKLSVEIGASLDSVISAYDMAVREGIDPASDSFDKFVKQALQLASVTRVDLPTAIATVDNVLDRFGTTLSKTPDAMDMLYRASRAGETGFQEFTNTLALTAQAAGALELPLDKVAALMALLGQRGMTGSRAGMAMGQALARLATASKDSADNLHALKVNVLDPTTGKVRDLADVFSDLRKAILSLPEAKRDTVLMELLGPAGFRVLGGLIKDVNTDFKGMFNTIAKGKGINDAFAESAKSAGHKLDVMKASITAARTEIGTAFLPVLAEAAEGLSGVLKALTPFIQANADLVVPLTGAALGLGAFGMAAGKAAWAVTLLRATWPAFFALFGPWSIAIMAVVTALSLVAHFTKGWTDKVNEAKTALSEKEARAELLRAKIKELESQQATYNKTLVDGTIPGLKEAKAELANLTGEADKLQKKLAELRGEWVIPETLPGVSAALQQAFIDLSAVQRQARTGWEGGEGAPIFASQGEEIERLRAYIDALRNKWAELATTQTSATTTTDALTGATVAGTAAALDNADAVMTMGKYVAEYVAKAKQAKLEAGWLAAPGAAGAALPTGPEEPIIPPLGEQAADEVDLVQSEWARLLESGISTADLLDTGFGAALSDMEPYAQEFADSFIYNFERMQAEGKNVLKSLAASFALAMMDMVKMAIHAAIAQIVATKIAQVAIASMQGFMTFGASLLEIGPILATAAGAIAALSGLQKKLGGYAAGGIVPQTGLVLAHAGERIINPAYNTASDLVNMLSGTRLAAALTPVPVASGAGAPGMAAASFYFHMPIYGNVNSELDMEKVMRKAADVFRSRAG